MAQDTVTDLRLDYSRDYQPVTKGPGNGYFTFRAIDGAGGKRLASVGYLLPDDQPGVYRLLIEAKQEGKGRLSAYNQSLVKTIEEVMIRGLRAELLQGGWRETAEGKWAHPDTVPTFSEEDLRRVEPEDLEAPAELLSQSTDFTKRPGYEIVAQLLEAAETLPPNGFTTVLLPNGVVCTLLHQDKFVHYLQLINQAEAACPD